MSVEPWSKFYWADWRSDPKLRMCSLGARGLWMELLSLMHSSDQFAHLLVNGNTPSDQQLAILCGASANEIRKLKAELARSGVPGVREDGIWFSRRMVRDKEKRLRDKANGSKGGNPNVNGRVNEGVNPPVNAPPPTDVNEGDKARGTRDPEARSQKPEEITSSQPSPEAARDDFFRKCFEHIVGLFPTLMAGNPAAIHQWKTAGYNFDTQVKPTVDSAAAKKAKPRSFNFFTAMLEDAARPIAPAPKKEPAVELTTEQREKNRDWKRKMGMHA